MKKAIPIALMALGAIFLAAGIYTVARGWDAKQQVRSELLAQNIVTPEDAAIPNTRVRDAATAQAMGDVIGKHVEERTGGRSYAEMGRFLAPGGGETNEEEEAVTGDDGRPVENPLRGMAFEASALRTGLYTSVMALNVSDLVLGLGLMITVLGLALAAIGFVLTGVATGRAGTDRRVDLVSAEAQPALQ